MRLICTALLALALLAPAFAISEISEDLAMSTHSDDTYQVLRERFGPKNLIPAPTGFSIKLSGPRFNQAYYSFDRAGYLYEVNYYFKGVSTYGSVLDDLVKQYGKGKYYPGGSLYEWANLPGEYTVQLLGLGDNNFALVYLLHPI